MFSWMFRMIVHAFRYAAFNPQHSPASTRADHTAHPPNPAARQQVALLAVSASQFLLQFLAMFLHQIHQQRRNAWTPPSLQSTLEGHSVQKLVDVHWEIDPACDMRSHWCFRFGLRCPFCHVSSEFSSLPTCQFSRLPHRTSWHSCDTISGKWQLTNYIKGVIIEEYRGSATHS